MRAWTVLRRHGDGPWQEVARYEGWGARRKAAARAATEAMSIGPRWRVRIKAERQKPRPPEGERG